MSVKSFYLTSNGNWGGFTSPSITPSKGGQVHEAVSVDYGTSTVNILAECNALLVDVTALSAALEILPEQFAATTDILIALNAQYQTNLSNYTAVLALYNEMYTKFVTDSGTVYDPVEKIPISVTTSFSELANSSQTQYGDPLYSTLYQVWSQTLDAGSYMMYCNFSGVGLQTGLGDRLNTNIMSVSIVNSIQTIASASGSSSNFCENNVTTTTDEQGMIAVLSNCISFTLTSATACKCQILLARESNPTFNTPNAVEGITYYRPPYTGETGNYPYYFNRDPFTLFKLSR
tara:strand:+ start:1841 stop:2710 length:870 start_codon:yes stop_codon:yes gene_type:complete